MWSNDFEKQEDSAGFANEPHGTLIYLVVLAACAALVLIVLRVPL